MLHCPLDEAADAVTEARVSVCVCEMLLYIPSFPDKESQFLVASRQYHTCWWHFHFLLVRTSRTIVSYHWCWWHSGLLVTDMCDIKWWFHHTLGMSFPKPWLIPIVLVIQPCDFFNGNQWNIKSHYFEKLNYDFQKWWIMVFIKFPIVEYPSKNHSHKFSQFPKMLMFFHNPKKNQ